MHIFLTVMARNYAIRRQLFDIASNIGDCVDQLNIGLRNGCYISAELMTELKHQIQNVDILQALNKAQRSKNIMDATISLLKLEQKRRMVTSEVFTYLFILFYLFVNNNNI